MMFRLPIPGRITLAPAVFDAYKTLRRFHYRPGDPRVPADIIAAWHQLPARPARCIGVAVLAWPTCFHRDRYRALGIDGWPVRDRIAFANANVRTISRVIVHPTFRAIGLSTRLARALILRCPTRYIEATAMMARAHPLFERAGMRRCDVRAGLHADVEAAPYYLFDKWLDRLPVEQTWGLPVGQTCDLPVGQTFLSATRSTRSSSGATWKAAADGNVCPAGSQSDLLHVFPKEATDQ